MNRRDLLTRIAPTAAAAALASPALAQSSPQIRWRMQSSFPKSLDTVFGGATFLAKRVADLTEGRFQLQVFAGGEIVPPLQVLDGVQKNTIEVGHTAGFYYLGKSPALGFDTGVPFGLTPRQHVAWMRHGGGLDLMREVYAPFNVVQFPCGNTGAQMGGWFRKEIRSVDDLKGLRMRAAGFLGTVYSKLGVTVQQLPAGDVYPALERGTLDAVEWVGPYDDEKLGFNKAAQYYYGPGVMELGASLCAIVNTDRWKELPEQYKLAFEVACADAYQDMLAKYDANNVLALRRLVAAGTQVRFWPREVMQALQKATTEALQDIANRDATFAKVYAAWKTFRDDQILWSSVNDGAAANFLISNRT
jgi:TRAP-type mannitol/chloroaromatic compound transport system substrate-binding protein